MSVELLDARCSGVLNLSVVHKDLFKRSRSIPSRNYVLISHLNI